MKIINIFTILILVITILISCKGSDETSSKESLETEDLIKYYNKSNPGKWKDLPDDHTPQYIISEDKKHKIITASVPFKGTANPIHYIEVMVLLDHNRKELQKKTFSRGNQQAITVFKLPKDYVSFVYVVSKCNLHDMWEVKINW